MAFNICIQYIKLILYVLKTMYLHSHDKKEQYTCQINVNIYTKTKNKQRKQANITLELH